MKLDIEKSIAIDAPLEKVRALVEDFAHWNSWSPWIVVEPECSVTVEGKAKQVGHSMSWDGDVIGSGNNTLRHFDEHRLDYDLAFLKPWKSKADVSFIFEEMGDKTMVTWTMQSSMPFFLFFMVKLVQNMVGMDYERGLRMLKEISEHGQLNCETINSGTVDYQGFSYIGIQRTCAISILPACMKEDFDKIVKDVVVDGNKSAEHWVSIYPKFDMKKMQATYIAAISDENVSGLDLDDSYIRGKIDDFKALEIKHNGSYDFLGNAWSMGMLTLQAKKSKAKGFPFEQYWNSPMEESPENLKTSIFFPVK